MKCLFYTCFITLLLLCLPVACVREKIEVYDQYAFGLKTVDADGNDLTDMGVVKTFDLYLFGEKGFIRKLSDGELSNFFFRHNKGERLTLAAWGNLEADSLEVPDPAVGTPIEQVYVRLREQAGEKCLPLPDLFFGTLAVGGGTTSTRGTNELTLVLERCVAEMSVCTHDLSNQFGRSEEPYRIVVRSTGSGLNFLGECVGGDVAYEPALTTDALGDAYLPPFRILPTQADKAITIDLYRGKKKLLTVEKDNLGNPIRVMAGRQLNVDVNFVGTAIRVELSIKAWGEVVSQDTEM